MEEPKLKEEDQIIFCTGFFEGLLKFNKDDGKKYMKDKKLDYLLKKRLI